MGTHSLTARTEGSSFSLRKHITRIMADTAAETTTPTTEAPVAEKSAEAEGVPEVASNGAAEESTTTNGEAVKETKEAETTNGSTTEETNDANEEVPAASNGTTTEAEEKKEESSSEAVKRKAEGETEKLNEAEEKLPAE